MHDGAHPSSLATWTLLWPKRMLLTLTDDNHKMLDFNKKCIRLVSAVANRKGRL
jgi:hypothetical protein